MEIVRASASNLRLLSEFLLFLLFVEREARAISSFIHSYIHSLKFDTSFLLFDLCSPFFELGCSISGVRSLCARNAVPLLLLPQALMSGCVVGFGSVTRFGSSIRPSASTFNLSLCNACILPFIDL